MPIKRKTNMVVDGSETSIQNPTDKESNDSGNEKQTCDATLQLSTPIYYYGIPVAAGYIFGFVMEKGRG